MKRQWSDHESIRRNGRSFSTAEVGCIGAITELMGKAFVLSWVRVHFLLFFGAEVFFFGGILNTPYFESASSDRLLVR